MTEHYAATLWILFSYMTTVFGVRGQMDPSRFSDDPPSCNVIPCVSPVKCSQFEHCLLVAEKNGCNPQIITYAAYETYRTCLFGPTGMCSLSPLADCYQKHLLEHTKTRLLHGTILEPAVLNSFISVLLSDAYGASCRIPVNAVQQMTQCIVVASGELTKNCASAMPLATQKYFSNNNLTKTIAPSINMLIGTLTKYTATCSTLDVWTKWFNDNHPSNQKPNEKEGRNGTCGQYQATSIECQVDENYKQTCKQKNCTTSQQCSLRIGGFYCKIPGKPPTNPCQCCDYKVRYLCPRPDSITVTPTYGPESGGTNLTVVGSNISTTDLIYLEKQKCIVIERSPSRVVCRVPRLRNGLGSKSKLVVQVFRYMRNMFIPTGATFTYKPAFEVNYVYNLNSPLSGGTNVTLEGMYFSSISNPRMIITVYYKASSKVARTWTYQTTCWVVSDVKINCPVPSLINPADVATNMTSGLQSTTSPTTTTMPASTSTTTTTTTTMPASSSNRSLPTPIQPVPYNLSIPAKRKRRSPININTQHAQIRRRHKRSTCDVGPDDSADPINDNDELMYDVAFDLDGKMVRGNYKMDVYADPQIESFEEDPACRVYQRWLLASDTEMEITGTGMANGLRCADYTVRVGVGFCSMQDLFTNRIICNPPDAAPEPGDGDLDGQFSVEVVIGNGNLRYIIGCLRYESMLLDNEWGRYGLIIGLGAAAVIILIIGICCCIYCRNKSKVI